MAGGDANDTRAPWPKGEDGLHLLEFGPVNVEASKAADHVFDTMTAQFKFKAVKAEFQTQTLTENNGITFNLEDDTGTAKVLINDAGVAAVVAGAGGVQALTVDTTVEINAGALLKASYKSGATDTSVQSKIRLCVKPTHG